MRIQKKLPLFTGLLLSSFSLMPYADVTILGVHNTTLIVDETTGDVIVNGSIEAPSTGISVEAETSTTIIVNGGVDGGFGNAINIGADTSLKRIENYGDISGDSAIYINSGEVFEGILNEGSLQGGGDNGLEIVSSVISGGIENRGYIYGGGGDSGIALYGDWQVLGGITNSGLIQGGGEEAITLGALKFNISDNNFIAYESFIDGDIFNSGTLEVVENGSSESIGVIALFSGVELRGSLINAGEIINSEAIANKESAGIYIGGLTAATELNGRELWLGEEGVFVEADIQSRITGNIINSGSIESVNGVAILIDNGSVGGVVNTLSGNIYSYSGSGDVFFAAKPLFLPESEIVLPEGLLSNESIISVGAESIVDLPLLPVGFDEDNYAIKVINNGSLGFITNEGVVNGNIDFGQNGGVYNAKGGFSGEVFNADRVNLQIGVPAISFSSLISDKEHRPTVSTIFGNFDLTGKELGVEVAGSATAIDYGQLSVLGDASLDNSKIEFHVSGEEFISGDDGFVFLQTLGDVSAENIEVSDNSLVLSFDVLAFDNALAAVISRTDFSLLVGGEVDQGSKNLTSIAVGIDTIPEAVANGQVSQDSELADIFNQLSSFGTVEDVASAINSLQPDVHQAGIAGALQLSDRTAGVVSERQASLRSFAYDGESGLPAGDMVAGQGFWLQVYGQSADRDSEGGIDGYELDSRGLALGYDSFVSNELTVGAVFSASKGDVDSDGLSGNTLDIDSYQISAYGTYLLSNYFIEAQLFYAQNRFEGERFLFNGSSAQADRDGDLYGLRAEAGYPVIFESGFRLTPNASFAYSYLTEDGYQEKGAGNAGLDVDEIDLESLVVGLGLDVSYHYQLASENVLVPSLHLEIQKDFLEEEVQLDSRFIGTSTSFSTIGLDNSEPRYIVGVGIQVLGQGNLSFDLRYDYIDSEDFRGQSLAGTLHYDF